MVVLVLFAAGSAGCRSARSVVAAYDRDADHLMSMYRENIDAVQSGSARKVDEAFADFNAASETARQRGPTLNRPGAFGALFTGREE